MRYPCSSLLGLLILAGGAQAQDLVRTCLDEQEAGLGLDLEVDRAGVIHLSRVRRLEDDLVYTRLDAAGGRVDEVVARGVSHLGGVELEDTDLGLIAGVPHICFHDPGVPGLRVAWRAGAGGEWLSEVVAEGRDVGRSCSLVEWRGRVVVAYRDGARLSVSERRGEDRWVRLGGDAVPEHEVGVDVELKASRSLLVAAHRDLTAQRLRLTALVGGRWLSEEVIFGDLPNGFRPALAVAGDQVWVAHGVVPAVPDVQGDSGLLFSFGRLPGPLDTWHLDTWHLDSENGGGDQGLVRTRGGRLLLLTRSRMRNVLFGETDGAWLYDSLPGGFDAWPVAFYPQDVGRHLLRRLNVAADPFGLPVVAFFDDASPFLDDPGGGFTCVYRPADADGDRVPDVEEARLGTRPDEPDTDGDGRDDGQELLEDGSDPRVPDEPRLDAGPPDAGPPDAAPAPDAALILDPPSPDAAPPHPDAASPDAASPAAVTPDAATPDAATPDAATSDAASPDAASPDAAASSDGGRLDAAAPLVDAAVSLDATAVECHARGEGACGRGYECHGGRCESTFEAGPRPPDAGPLADAALTPPPPDATSFVDAAPRPSAGGAAGGCLTLPWAPSPSPLGTLWLLGIGALARRRRD